MTDSYDAEAMRIARRTRLAFSYEARKREAKRALLRAHTAGRREEREAVRGVVAAAQRFADCYAKHPGPPSPCWSLLNDLRNALTAYEAQSSEAGMASSDEVATAREKKGSDG